MACEIWLRRDFLLERGLIPVEPECDCPPEHCPRATDRIGDPDA